MTKLTKRDHFNALLAIKEVASNETLVAFIENELELLNRKKANGNKPTKEQEANNALKEAIVEALTGKLMTISELQKLEQFSGYSNQKLNALIKILRDEHRVERIEDKRKAYFTAK